MQRLSLKSIFAAVLVFTLCFFTVGAFAQDDYDPFADEFSDDMPAEMPGEATAEANDLMPSLSGKSEQEYMDSLISSSVDPRAPFSPRVPDKDPFKAIVEKKVIAPPTRVQQPIQVSRVNKPAPPPVKPIKIFVSGIVGNEDQRLAIIKFENNEMTVSKEQIVEGKFKVVDIQNDRIVVYSNKEQRRHTFKIGGDEKDG
ncbi:MAG: hypothetical protein WC221_04395 [Candidatus Riflebacteria bacterium]